MNQKFKLQVGKTSNSFLAVVISAVIIPIVNTGIYMLGMVIMQDAVAAFLSLNSWSAGIIFTVVFGLIWLNFVLEMAINLIFIPIIHRVIKVVQKAIRTE